MPPKPEEYRPTSQMIGRMEEADLSSLHSGVIYHGTGRYGLHYLNRDKSQPTGKTHDVLRSILSEGLVPAKDHIARVALPIAETVSLTRERLYARVYGELFGQNNNGRSDLEYVFGDYTDWAKFFIEETRRQARTYANITWLPRIAWNMATRFSIAELREIANVEHHKKRWYVNQNGIKGNYPCVLGLEGSAISPIKLPIGLDAFEVRHGEVIPPDQIRFIETPENRIEETRRLVREAGLQTQILPMELCEVYSQQKALAA
jgi:hypothetical protein